MPIYDDAMADTQDASSTPGLGAVTAPGLEGTYTPMPTLDESTYNQIFGQEPAGTAAPVYGADSRGAAMHQEEMGGTAPGKAGDIIRFAKTMVGLPYVWGGTDAKSGVDCSGLIYLAYKHAGIDIPRVSYQQARAGKVVSARQAQAGDIISWDNSTRNNGADHVALYLGGGLMLEAARPGVPVRIRKLGADEGASFTRVL